MEEKRGELRAFGQAGQKAGFAVAVQVVADDAETVEVGQAGRGQEVAVGAAAGVLPAERREAEVAAAMLEGSESGFLGGAGFLRRAVEAKVEFEADALAGVERRGELAQAGFEAFAVRGAGDAHVDLRAREVGHDVGGGAAALDAADVDEHAGQFGGQAVRGDEELGERGDGVAPVVGNFARVRGATAAGDGDAAGALARAHEIAVGTGGLEHERKAVARGGRGKKRGAAVRAGFLVGREQHLAAERGSVAGLQKGFQRGEQDHKATLHVGHAGAAQHVFVDERAALERMSRAVNGVVVSAEQNLLRRVRLVAHAQRPGGSADARRAFDDDAGQRGEFRREQIEHGGEAGGMIAAGILIAPADKQVAQTGTCGGQGGDCGGQDHTRSLPQGNAPRQRYGAGRRMEISRLMIRIRRCFPLFSARHLNELSLFMSPPPTPLRRVAARHRVLFASDTCSFFYHPELLWPEGRPYTGELVHRFVERLARNGVDTFLVNPNAQTVWYPSKKLENLFARYTRGDRDFFRGQAAGYRIPPEKLDRFLDDCVAFYDQYLDWLDAGVDWLAEAAKACRRHGVSPWLSVRMNDMHGADNPEGSYLNCELFKHAKFRLRGAQLNPAHGTRAYWQALNYEHREVRDYFFSLIREGVADYGYDGLELDWLRNPHCCEPGATQKTVDLITGWIAEVRALTQARARASGRPCPFGLRLPPSLAYLRSIGLDVAALARAGLIDFVSASNFWQTAWDMPYDRLRAALGDEVALYGVIEDAPNWVFGVAPGRPRGPEHHNPGARYLSASAELLRGNAAGKLAMGVDGIYVYNFHCTDQAKLPEMPARYPVLKNLDDLTALRGAEKHYCLATPGVNAPFWDIPCQLPAVLETGYRREFQLAMCREPAAGLRLFVQVIYGKRDAVPPLGVSLNGALPAFAGAPARQFLFPTGIYADLPDEHESLVFELDPALIEDGWNSVVIYNDELNPETLAAGDPARAVRILSLELAVKKRG